MAVNDAGGLPPGGVGGWMVLFTSRLVLTRELLKFGLAIGLPDESNEVVFLLSACAIRSGFSHQN